MSRLLEVEDAWYDVLVALAARSSATTGTADSGSTSTLVDAALTGTDWRWAVVSMTSGANNGSWRVVTAWSDATDTCSFHSPFDSAIATGDTFSITFAPIYGAKIFMRRPFVLESLQNSELPAVFVATERRRRVQRDAVGNSVGARRASLEVVTDCLSACKPGVAADDGRLASDKLFEQVDSIRLAGVTSAKRLTSTVRILDPNTDDTISAYAESAQGLRVYWSRISTQFQYAT